MWPYEKNKQGLLKFKCNRHGHGVGGLLRVVMSGRQINVPVCKTRKIQWELNWGQENKIFTEQTKSSKISRVLDFLDSAIVWYTYSFWLMNIESGRLKISNIPELRCSWRPTSRKFQARLHFRHKNNSAKLRLNPQVMDVERCPWPKWKKGLPFYSTYHTITSIHQLPSGSLLGSVFDTQW